MVSLGSPTHQLKRWGLASLRGRRAPYSCFTAGGGIGFRPHEGTSLRVPGAAASRAFSGTANTTWKQKQSDSDKRVAPPNGERGEEGERERGREGDGERGREGKKGRAEKNKAHMGQLLTRCCITCRDLQQVQQGDGHIVRDEGT